MVAFLRLLANLTLLSDGCVIVRGHARDIFDLIDNGSAAVQRQVWALLLHLSCDADTLPTLLRTEVSRFTTVAKVQTPEIPKNQLKTGQA